MDIPCIYSGKVRNIYELDSEHLLLQATDRVSAFNKHLGIIPGKGKLLNKMSEFWFNKTKFIIDNHCLFTKEACMIVKKCIPFKIEFVVRGYITGSTNTSLWTHYNNGNRIYCGINFPDGLLKNQKLKEPVVTPTTKTDNDEPISKEDIINNKYMLKHEYEFVHKKALELFEYGQKLANKVGFILLDTKYEFGKTPNGDIILIDELHTCDSSRYWIKDTYDERFTEKKEPDKLDKDCIREWIKLHCDPYTENIPPIPKNIINKASSNYKFFYDQLIS